MPRLKKIKAATLIVNIRETIKWVKTNYRGQGHSNNPDGDSGESIPMVAQLINRFLDFETTQPSASAARNQLRATNIRVQNQLLTPRAPLGDGRGNQHYQIAAENPPPLRQRSRLARKHCMDSICAIATANVANIAADEDSDLDVTDNLEDILVVRKVQAGVGVGVGVEMHYTET